MALEDDEIGVCLSETAVGGPCEYGHMAPGSKAYRDQVEALERHPCATGRGCDTNFQGFALGACSISCRSNAPGSVCSDFLDIDGFQKCMRQRRSVEQCATEYVFGAGAQACDAQRACRQDYVCVRTRTAGVGACLPPYFVYQLRLDGYPIRQ